MNPEMFTNDSRYFLLGVVLALCPRTKLSSHFSGKLLMQICGLLALAFVLGNPQFKVNLYWIFSLIILVFQGQKNLMGNRFFTWLGKRSFSFYLCHIPVLEIVGVPLKLMDPSWALLLLSISLVVFSTIAYEIFEIKIYRYGQSSH
jgi:peptidoglycan/LPS O-acetylase OafA/YrhL